MTKEIELLEEKKKIYLHNMDVVEEEYQYASYQESIYDWLLEEIKKIV